MSADDLPEATGYHYTHYDCPECSCAGEQEGDVRGEEFECEDCGCKFRVK